MDAINAKDTEFSFDYLNRIRNEIVGSNENKLEYINNLQLKNILNEFVNIKENNFDCEKKLNLLMSIVNSFIITHSNELKIILPNFSVFTSKSLKVLMNKNYFDKNLYESCFRLLKTLSVNGMLSLENVFSSGILGRIEEFLINDVLYGYILVILNKICESSYYKFSIYSNEKLIIKIIEKFLNNKNNSLNVYLLELLVSLTEDSQLISQMIYSKDFMKIISTYIRDYDKNIKILAINLMINVYKNLKLNYEKEINVIYSNSILINLLKDTNEYNIISIKLRIVNIFAQFSRRYASMQTIFYNLSGVEILLSELRSLFTENQIKEMEDHVKIIKQTKIKKNERIFILEKEDDYSQNMNKNENPNLEEKEEYKRCLIECLSSVSLLNEESRKKITESKEMSILLYLVEDSPSKIMLACINLFFSLSRAHISVKKLLHEYDITSTFFRLTCHPKVEIQIAVTNSLCNFLLDYSSSSTDVMECIAKLVKIFQNTKHSKIRFNTIFSIKNIFHYINTPASSSSNKEIKKNIMKKITYDLLLSLLDDEDFGIQEQGLIIFRNLLIKTPEDIEEVFINCKQKLIKKLEEKIKSDNKEIVEQALYLFMNLSLGNEKQKSAILEKGIFQGMSQILCGDNLKLKSVVVNILNNLIKVTNEKSPELIDKKSNLFVEFDIFKKLDNLYNNIEEEDSEIKKSIEDIFRSRNLLK